MQLLKKKEKKDGLCILIQRDLQNIWTKQGADRCVWYAIICININNKEYGRFMCVCKRYIKKIIQCADYASDFGRERRWLKWRNERETFHWMHFVFLKCEAMWLY